MNALKRYGWAAAALAAVALLLMLALHSPDRQKGLTEYEAAGTMRHIATADVTAVQIGAGTRALRLERRNGAWPEDAAAIEAALRLLHNTPPERSFEVATPEFGLDPPAFTVRVQTADGRAFEADFGATNPMGLAHYVRVRSAGTTTLHLMPGYVAEAWEPLAKKAAR